MNDTTTTTVQNYEPEDDGLSTFSLDQLGQQVSTFGGARILKFVAGKMTSPEKARRSARNANSCCSG